MFKQLKCFLMLGTLIILLSGASATAATGVPPDGSFCGSDSDGNVFRVALRNHSVNVTVLSPQGSTCQVNLVLQVIHGNVFTYPSPSSYSSSYCSVADNLGLAGFKSGNAIVSYKKPMGSAAIVAASPCTPPANGAYCGKNSGGHVVVLEIRTPSGMSYPSSSADLLPLVLSYRSNTSDNAQWLLDCSTSTSGLLSHGTLSTTGTYSCMTSLAITTTTGGFTVSFTKNTEQLSVKVTRSGCQGASGTYYGTAGSYGAMIATTSDGYAVFSMPPLGPVAMSDTMSQSSVFTMDAAPYFIVGGSFYTFAGWSKKTPPVNVTTIKFASNAFTLSYDEDTTAALTQQKPAAISNSVFCGSVGNRSLFFTVGSVGEKMTVTEFVGGKVACTATIEGLVVSSGAALISKVSGTCKYAGVSLTYASSKGFTMSTGSNTVTLASCTASQPAGRYCGGTASNAVVIDTNTQSVKVFSSNPSECSSMPLFATANGAVLNASASSFYFRCNLPLHITSFKSGTFTAIMNGKSMTLTKAACAAPVDLNGTFCGSSSSVFAKLSVKPGYSSSYMGQDIKSPSSVSLLLGSTKTGFAETYSGELNPSAATTTSLLLTLTSQTSSDVTFVLTSLVPGAKNTTLTLTGRHTVLGAVKVTLAVSSCGADKSLKLGYCGISGSQEIVARGGEVSVAWLNSSSQLTICQAATYMLISGKYYLAKPANLQCPIDLPVSVTGLTAGKNGLTVGLESEGTASNLDLAAATCPKSIIPTRQYCGTVGDAVVVAKFGDLQNSAIQFGSCVYSVVVTGVSSSGVLDATVTSTDETCAAVTSMTWDASAASLDVAFSTSGSAVLTDCGDDPAPEGKYCGLIGDAIATLNYRQGQATFSFSSSDQSRCSDPLTVVYNDGQYTFTSQNPSCSVSTIPSAFSFAKNIFTVTIGGTTGKLQLNACDFPLSTYCGVDTKAKKQIILAALNGMYGVQYVLRIADAAGGLMDSVSLYASWTAANALVLNVNGNSVLVTVSNVGVINLALTNVYLNGQTMSINAALKKNSC